jgi:hypothetical protein
VVLPESQWGDFYVDMVYNEGIYKKFEEFSKPVENWTDDPNEYFIVGLVRLRKNGCSMLPATVYL